jgi:hypothetical protein
MFLCKHGNGSGQEQKESWLKKRFDEEIVKGKKAKFQIT